MLRMTTMVSTSVASINACFSRGWIGHSSATSVSGPMITPCAPSARRASSGNSDPVEDLSLEDYFQRFVMEHQDSMSETELAQKLGVSRKCLWERRQRLGIPRNRATASQGGKPATREKRALPGRIDVT